MPTPLPPVPIKDSCSIIHNKKLYVYSPDAFQSISLEKDAKWVEETNGESVTGAVCVKGGVDGDNSKTALYVVGGAANSSNLDYPGLQRFTFEDRKWQTIEPVVKVTQNRQYHGAAYMNASSALVVYGGSQNGYDGLSSETFIIEMYPPFRAQAYSSTAPPTKNAFMLPWSEDRALMVGGSDTNLNVFTFGPADGWNDMGLDLPNVLPESSLAQPALFTLEDGSKILQTFCLDRNPPNITNNVLLNPGGAAANFGQVAGVPPQRRAILSTYPLYNDTNAPTATRTGFSLAQDSDGTVALVGGNDDEPVEFFNQNTNSWIPATQILGDQVRIPTESPSTSATTPTSSAQPTATKESSSDGGGGGKRGLTILGGVLGGICLLAAIIIIVLLAVRNRRRRKHRQSGRKQYPNGKKGSSDFSFEEGVHPLAMGGQAMGRSPVTSVVIDDVNATAMSAHPGANKGLIRRVSSDAKPGLTQSEKSAALGQNLFKTNKEKSPLARSPLTISKPFMPVLNDYQERPSVELGRATPASPTHPVNATPMAAMPARNKSQRKTDQAWAAYFQGGDVNPTTTYEEGKRSPTRGSSFWPGTGVVEPKRGPKAAYRDSRGNTLQTGSVGTASPAYENGPQDPSTKVKSTCPGEKPRISNAVSTFTDRSDYDDVDFDAYSSGIPASIHDQTWTPMGNGRSSNQGFGMPTTSSGNTKSTESSGIPNFPMPSATRGLVGISQVPAPNYSGAHPREGSGYFTQHTRNQSSQANNDMSWLNLGGQTSSGGGAKK